MRTALHRGPTGTGARLLVAGGLTGYVAAVYGLLVLGGGALLDSRPPSLPLAVVATAIVALTFEPVHRALASRMVTSPYDVLAEFTGRVSDALAPEDLAPRMAQLLAEGTGARRVEVWLREDGAPDGERLAARWPPDAQPLRPGTPGCLGHDVVHAGEVIGRILREPHPDGVPLHRTQQQLLDDLLASAGVALQSLALTTGLHTRIEQTLQRSAELRASRQRIVATADAARRRLERDVHDGAQQHLVALAVNLSLAATVAGRDPGRAADMIDELRSAAEAAQATLDELSRGIYPRSLVESGPAAALRAAWHSSPLPVHLHDATARRHPVEIESAAYFGCLEAVQNAVKHSAGSRVEVRLTESAGTLQVEVADDGTGFDPATVADGAGLANMRTRIESLGGALTVHSRPGCGTTVVVRIPVAEPPGGGG